MMRTLTTNPPTVLKALLILSLAISLSFCSVFKKDKDKDSESERTLYESAQKALNSKQYSTAVDYFRKIELRFPFGRYAEQAQLEAIYANYMSVEMPAVSASAERFIRQHPEHPNLDFAYYMKGLASFNVDKGFLGRIVKDGTHKRDLTSVRSSYFDFLALIQRFPESDFAADAQQRMVYLRDLLARNEMVIAEFYMQRTAYVAATNRARYVIENYPQTSSQADALAIMAYAYNELGSPELVQNALLTLNANFPEDRRLLDNGALKPYEHRYIESPHLINFFTFGLIKVSKEERKAAQPIELTSPVPAPTPVEVDEASLTEVHELNNTELEALRPSVEQ